MCVTVDRCECLFTSYVKVVLRRDLIDQTKTIQVSFQQNAVILFIECLFPPVHQQSPPANLSALQQKRREDTIKSKSALLLIIVVSAGKLISGLLVKTRPCNMTTRFLLFTRQADWKYCRENLALMFYPAHALKSVAQFHRLHNENINFTAAYF